MCIHGSLYGMELTRCWPLWQKIFKGCDGDDDAVAKKVGWTDGWLEKKCGEGQGRSNLPWLKKFEKARPHSTIKVITNTDSHVAVALANAISKIVVLDYSPIGLVIVVISCQPCVATSANACQRRIKTTTFFLLRITRGRHF